MRLKRTVEVDIPEELLKLVRRSSVGARPVAEQVRVALAIHLYQEGLITVAKAASMAGEPRATFEPLLAGMGIPALRYDVEDYRQDREAFQSGHRKWR